jgi:hypothetical protein
MERLKLRYGAHTASATTFTDGIIISLITKLAIGLLIVIMTLLLRMEAITLLLNQHHETFHPDSRHLATHRQDTGTRGYDRAAP